MMKKAFMWLRTRIAYSKKKTSRHQSFDKAGKIGILLNNPDFTQNDSINRFVRSLKDQGKEVNVLCFLDEGVNRLYDFPYLELRKKDLTLTGGFQSEKINNFVKSRFDYLYSINISPFLPFKNILSRNQSAVRIGKYFSGSDKYLDIMIDMQDKDDLQSLIKKMNELIPNLSFHD